MNQVGAQALTLTECSPPGDTASTMVAQGPPALRVFFSDGWFHPGVSVSSS